MPQTLDHEAMSKALTLDLSAPQRQANQPGTGLVVKQIPHLEFPKCVYKHPVEPFKTIVHRNAKFEVVAEETVPAEHISKAVNDEAELKAALAEGWVREPFVPAPLPDPNANLYAAPAPKKAGK